MRKLFQTSQQTGFLWAILLAVVAIKLLEKFEGPQSSSVRLGRDCLGTAACWLRGTKKKSDCFLTFQVIRCLLSNFRC